MQVIHDKKELKLHLGLRTTENKTLGLVPTMGALHEGHLSLIQKAISDNNVVVVSIFVNPTQFNNPADLQKYPNALEADLKLLKHFREELIIFAPSVSEMYRTNITSKEYDFEGLDKVMEGEFREGHFNGVGTIVEQLLTLISPNKAYFGEKDFQQLQIIRKLVAITNIPVEIIGCPIVREPHGLAMSSRNEQLSSSLRKKAAIIYQTLQTAKIKFGTKSASKVMEYVQKEFEKQSNFTLEYIQITDVDTLTPVRRKQKDRKYRAFLAVYADGVRLIDNIALN